MCLSAHPDADRDPCPRATASGLRVGLRVADSSGPGAAGSVELEAEALLRHAAGCLRVSYSASASPNDTTSDVYTTAIANGSSRRCRTTFSIIQRTVTEGPGARVLEQGRGRVIFNIFMLLFILLLIHTHSHYKDKPVTETLHVLQVEVEFLYVS